MKTCPSSMNRQISVETVNQPTKNLKKICVIYQAERCEIWKFQFSLCEDLLSVGY